MHPTNPLRQALSRALLLSVLVGAAAPAVAPAQPAAAPAKPVVVTGTLTLPIGGTQRLQMTKKQPITRALNANETILRITPVYGDPTTVLLVGLEPGAGRVTLVDADGNEELFDVIVQRDIELLKSLLKRALPTANIDPIPGANNTIVLRGTVARAEDIDVALRITESVVGLSAPAPAPGAGTARVINALRVGGVQQVQLCVVVASVNRTEERRLGFSFLETGGRHFVSSTIGGGASLTGSLMTSVASASTTFQGSPDVLFGIMGNKQSFLGVLDALRTEGVAKLLSEPRVVTLSGQPAQIVSGGEVPVITASQGGPSVAYKKFGTVLNFLPIVLGDGKIYLQVSPEVSQRNAANDVTISSGFGPTVVPGFNTQSASVTVEMEPGQTLAIGGLIQHTVNATASKVPVLGDLPYIGAAFSVKDDREADDELVILVTPHLVDPMSCDQLPKLLPGQETRSPDDYELFLEGILEAPRGPRTAKQDGHYVPAYKNGPSAAQYPCAGRCNGGGCANGSCGGDTHPVGGPFVEAQPAAVAPIPVDSHAAAPAADGVTPAAASEPHKMEVPAMLPALPPDPNK